MNFSLSLKACGILVAALAPLGAGVTSEEIRARMDQASAKFLQMTADVQQTTHTAVLNEDNTVSGMVRMRRTPTGEIQELVELTKPDQKFYSFEKRKLRIYTPKINTIQEIDLRAHGDQLDQFLSLGFGTSGKELAKEYKVEVIADNKVPRTTLLELRPLDPEVQKYLKKIDLWITDENYPVQEKLWEPSGDTILVNYSDVHINPHVTPSAFELHTAPNPTVVHP